MIRVNLLKNRRIEPPTEEASSFEGFDEPVVATEPPAGTTSSMGASLSGFDDASESYYSQKIGGINSFRLALLIGGAMIVGMVVWAFLAGGVVDAARAERTRLENELVVAAESRPDIESLIVQHGELAARVDSLTILANPGGATERYINLMSEINLSLPQRDLWLTELRERDGSVAIKGNSFNHFALADILDDLLESEYLSKVKQGGAKSAEIGGSKLLQFEFSAHLD